MIFKKLKDQKVSQPDFAACYALRCLTKTKLERNKLCSQIKSLILMVVTNSKYVVLEHLLPIRTEK